MLERADEDLRGKLLHLRGARPSRDIVSDAIEVPFKDHKKRLRIVNRPCQGF
jgi:hypothetical protein